MIISKVGLATVEQAAKVADVNLNELKVLNRRGDRFRLTIRPNGSNEFRKISPFTGRRVNAVCWHGHKGFFDALFAEQPGAKVVTMFATYDGIEQYRERYRETGDVNVGSYFQPAQLHTCCHC